MKKEKREKKIRGNIIIVVHDITYAARLDRLTSVLTICFIRTNVITEHSTDSL